MKCVKIIQYYMYPISRWIDSQANMVGSSWLAIYQRLWVSFDSFLSHFSKHFKYDFPHTEKEGKSILTTIKVNLYLLTECVKSSKENVPGDNKLLPYWSTSYYFERGSNWLRFKESRTYVFSKATFITSLLDPMKEQRNMEAEYENKLIKTPQPSQWDRTE